MKITIGGLRCKNLARETNSEDKIGALSTQWVESIDIFKVPNMLYIPEYGVEVCYGFVPEEAINYAPHLDLRIGHLRNDQSPVIDLDVCDRSPAEVCILGHIVSHTFYHWTEELHKVVLLEAFGFTGAYVIKSDYPDFCAESLDLLGIEPKRIIRADKPVVYKAAFLTTPVHNQTASRFPMLIRHLRDRLHEAAGGATGVGARVWAERGANAHRAGDIINRQEVNECIGRYGFVSVDFSQYTFKEQVAIDRDIEVMAGPHGAAFAHCSFMRQRQDIVEIFSPNYITPQVIQLCKVMQHCYHQIVPIHWDNLPYPYGREIMVNTNHLDLVLSSVHERQSGA